MDAAVAEPVSAPPKIHEEYVQRLRARLANPVISVVTCESTMVNKALS